MSVAVSFPPNPSPFPPRAASSSAAPQPSPAPPQPTSHAQSSVAQPSTQSAQHHPGQGSSVASAVSARPPAQPPGAGVSSTGGGTNGSGGPYRPVKRESQSGPVNGVLHSSAASSHPPHGGPANQQQGNSGSAERRDTLGLKRRLMDGLGRDDFKIYWRALGLFLTGRLTRGEMEDRVGTMLGARLRPLHNNLLISLINNARLPSPKAPLTPATGTGTGVKRKAEWDTEENPEDADGRGVKRTRGEEEDEEAPLFIPLQRIVPLPSPNRVSLPGSVNAPAEPLPPSLSELGDLPTFDHLRAKLRVAANAERVGEVGAIPGMPSPAVVGRDPVQDGAVEVLALGLEAYLKNLLSACISHIRNDAWRTTAPTVANVSSNGDLPPEPIEVHVHHPVQHSAEHWSDDEQETERPTTGPVVLVDGKGKRPSLRVSDDTEPKRTIAPSRTRNGSLERSPGKRSLGDKGLPHPEHWPTQIHIVESTTSNPSASLQPSGRLNIADLLYAMAAHPHLAPTYSGLAQEVAVVESAVEEAEAKFWDGSYVRDAELDFRDGVSRSDLHVSRDR
ncbi:hypothetical protein M427DRAFT_55114 [Gonapodya prolifera JEL478]|uniref:Transcriptional regulator of RNA polII, SAGA, subunit-domain-containing protein n=1 Tax=Gonapodya prolifera (strain JEL478) TaxID=1344416 RepID=A0A139AK23_GONPJ|nr:hypothetical protein M427DRAFT_55114 [Gonapodya prolifera JEL478]|eukprot:KXS16775.1 hypothetical protein M427DRAFT_55114 [Gonapodya prolifera JEL478]